MAEGDEREVRAARNQALFRTVNEKLRTLNETFSEVSGTFSIACECADLECVEVLEIKPDEYLEIRRNPRHFAVLTGHVYPEVENVIAERDGYVVVEKFGVAGEVAETIEGDVAAADPGDA